MKGGTKKWLDSQAGNRHSNRDNSKLRERFNSSAAEIDPIVYKFVSEKLYNYKYRIIND